MGPKSLYFATPFAFKLNPADGAVPYIISPESDISLKKLHALGHISVAESLGISSTTFTQCAAKSSELGEITQNKGPVASRPLAGRQVGSGQARFGCFHDCCFSENNYFDQLNFTFDCHDYIAVTHNRNCNHLSIPSTSRADVCT